MHDPIGFLITVIIVLSPLLIVGLLIAVPYLISRWWFWVLLFVILSFVIGPQKAHSQGVPLEQYVQQYFKEKAAREAFEARLPKPKPTPIPELPPYPNIFAPYQAPSLLDSIPKRDYQPLYIRPEIVPAPAPRRKNPSPAPHKVPPKTLYVAN